MEINTEVFGDVVIMQFHGTLTREVLKDMEEAFNDAVGRLPEVIALDFRNVIQIDSICINHLFKMVRTAEEKKFDLVIYDVFESLKKIFEVIKLDKVITIMTGKQFESKYLKDV